MVYTITKYTLKRAKQLGVMVKPSQNKTKKIDVFKENKKIASVGAYGMNDYPTYIINDGLNYANNRRRLYKIRHNSDRKIKWSRGWLADNLLW